MEKLLKIISNCKASVSLTVNQHRDYYMSVDNYVSEGSPKEIEPEVLAEMIRLDTVVELQFYPNTPIGFYIVYHYDVGKAIDIALETLELETAK